MKGACDRHAHREHALVDARQHFRGWAAIWQHKQGGCLIGDRESQLRQRRGRIVVQTDIVATPKRNAV